MSRGVRGWVAAIGVTAVLAGCGGGDQTPGAASGQYAGRSGDVGAVVDFRAVDEVADRIRELVGPRRVRVVAAYIVNRSNMPMLVPAFSAERFDGRLAPMERADADPLVKRAGIILPDAVPGRGAATVYLLTRERPEAVTAIVMRPARGEPVRLDPQDV